MMEIPIRLLGGVLGVLAAVGVGVLMIWVLVKGLGLAIAGVGKVFGGIGRLVAHVFGRLKGIVVDAVRYVTSLMTAIFFIPLVVGNIALGRWSAANHYGRAAGSELRDGILALYRCTISHPLHLIGLGSLLHGLEQRIPDVIARAPGADRPAGGKSSFDGYEVVGSLPPGGSGAKLYLANPLDEKEAQLTKAGLHVPDRVVIKAFSLESGSTLPQIVRESRALEAARDLGLVLEHELTPTSFHYVMPFVPGEDLGEVGRGLHSACGPDGLDKKSLRAVMGYGSGLLGILSRFHRAGLWHKDIKPNNVMVAGDRVELVDLGLVTPLSSAMTLTTHGTEYYRDPELVRQAMQGVKVQDVDGVKFDLYSTGAVLYNLVENEFPAHGSLSKITKRCPDALRWIIRRSMADMRSRYGSADEMLEDVRVLLTANDPFAVKPAQLPSMGGEKVELPESPEPDEFAGFANASKGGVAPDLPTNASGGRFGPPPFRRKRRRTVPLGGVGIAGVTLAVLAIPAGLAVLGGTVSSSHGRVLTVSHDHQRPSRWGGGQVPEAMLASDASGASVEFLRGFQENRFGQWPSVPPPAPIPVHETEIGKLLVVAPEPPSSVATAFSSTFPPQDAAWLEDTDFWVDRFETWLDMQEHALEGAGDSELERVVVELEAWVDDFDSWLADLEFELESHQGMPFDSISVDDPVLIFDDVHVAASPGRPTDAEAPRVLMLASGAGAVSKAQRQALEQQLAERLGWQLVSDVITLPTEQQRADDLDLLSTALMVAGSSPIDDPAVNDELEARLIAAYDLDGIVRYEWQGSDEQPVFWMIDGDADSRLPARLERAVELVGSSAGSR